MKIMKKFFSLALAVCLLVSFVLLTACESERPNDTVTTDDTDPVADVTDSETNAPEDDAYTVTVYDNQGNLKAGAQVVFLLDGATVATMTTNSEGVVSAKLSPALYTVVVSAEGFEVYADGYTFGEGEYQMTIFLSLPAGTTQESAIVLSLPLEEPLMIAAGETVWYRSFGLNGSTLTIDQCPDLTVHLGDSDYTPVDGKLEIAIVSDDTRTPTAFSVTNNTVSAISILPRFEYPLGTMLNPIVITELGTITVNVTEEGLYYTYTATAAGTLKLETLFEKNDMVINNITTSRYGNHTAGSALSTEMTVSAGDEIQFVIGTSDFATATFEVTVSFVPAQ